MLHTFDANAVARVVTMVPNKNSTQQKRHPIMLFENNYTLNKWHMTNTPPRIKKFGADQKMTPYKNDTTKSDTFAKRHNLQKDV